MLSLLVAKTHGTLEDLRYGCGVWRKQAWAWEGLELNGNENLLLSKSEVIMVEVEVLITKVLLMLRFDLMDLGIITAWKSLLSLTFWTRWVEK